MLDSFFALYTPLKKKKEWVAWYAPMVTEFFKYPYEFINITDIFQFIVVFVLIDAHIVPFLPVKCSSYPILHITPSPN